MAPHSSTLAWKIPWTEEPGRLQSMGLLRVGYDWATSLHFHALETEMATHSSVLAWRIPGTGEPSGHDWSDFAAAAAAGEPSHIRYSSGVGGRAHSQWLMDMSCKSPSLFLHGGNNYSAIYLKLNSIRNCILISLLPLPYLSSLIPFRLLSQ